MAKQRQIFCAGAAKRNVNAELANHIFDLMEKFAGYGFNKSHSASYALIAYQTAWLKTHYSAAFMAAVLSSDMDRTEKIIVLLNECQALKLHVSPPDINHSDYCFKVIDDHHIMYGLGAIKGVGEAAIENMIAARNDTGPFKDLFDFCLRVDLRKVNRRVLEALIKSGCFDTLGTHRAALMASIHSALQQAEQAWHDQTYGQHDLLGIETHAMTSQFLTIAPWSNDVQLQGEKETLGFYLSGHPLNRFLNELAQVTTCRIAEIHPNHQQTARAAGMVSHIRLRQTKRGDRIAIFTLDDGTSQIEVVCFAECLQKYRALVNEDQLLIVDGEVSLDEFSNKTRITARELYTIEQARERFAKYLQINLTTTQQLDLQHLKQVLTQRLGGNCPVILRYLHNNIQANIRLGKKWLVTPTETLLSLLQEQLVIESVEIKY